MALNSSRAQQVVLVGLIFLFVVEEDLITKFVKVSKAAFTPSDSTPGSSSSGNPVVDATRANPDAPGIGSDCGPFHSSNSLPSGFHCGDCSAWVYIQCSAGANFNPFYPGADKCGKCSDCSAWGIQCGSH